MSATRSSTRRPPASRPRTVPPVYSLRRELTTKRRGELAELVFQLIATRMGFAVCKPYGDSERYDFVLDARRQLICHPEEGAVCPTKDLGGPCEASRCLPGKNARSARILCPIPLLWRVQVKASTQLLNGLYRINAHRRTGRRAVAYRPGEIDFIAAYIIPEDTWYIIPLHAVRGTSLLFRRKKDRRPSLYAQYKEAWHLLRPQL
jgi:PD-(D/E)XK endonuclease